MINDGVGAAQGVKRAVNTVVRNQAETILRGLDIVKREEFEAVKDMARLAREENEALKARLAALEAKRGVSASAPGTGSPKTEGGAHGLSTEVWPGGGESVNGSEVAGSRNER